MNFYKHLVSETEAARQDLLSIPIIQAALQGQVDLDSYKAFLQEAYHHVKHTVHLLDATRKALPPHHEWLIEPLNEYIEEETGHEEWILDDIAACGGQRDSSARTKPGLATEVMVAFAYDTIARGNPLGFFGMVYVLEGTSVALAIQAADRIQETLKLPNAAFSYLRSHGTLDLEHADHFELLMGQIERPEDQSAIVQAAKAFYKLYGDVFRSLPKPNVGGTRLETLAC